MEHPAAGYRRQPPSGCAAAWGGPALAARVQVAALRKRAAAASIAAVSSA